MHTWQIIGLIIAVVMVIAGIILLFLKPRLAKPIMPDEIEINMDCFQPVLPRHLRQLAADLAKQTANIPRTPEQQATEAQRNANAQQVSSVPHNNAKEAHPSGGHDARQDTTVASNHQQQVDGQSTSQATDVAPIIMPKTKTMPNIRYKITLSRKTDISTPSLRLIKNPSKENESIDPMVVDALRNFDFYQDSGENNTAPTTPTPTPQVQDIRQMNENIADQTVQTKTNTTLKLPNEETETLKKFDFYQEPVVVETGKITEWQGESKLLDAHLYAQHQHDEACTLAMAERFVTFYLYPSTKRAMMGEQVLNILRKYGLRFGEKSCFHRYRDTAPVQHSPLMFSILQMDVDNQPIGFDLEKLFVEQVYGLAFFLALPHEHAIEGFDMMMSIAKLMARDLECTLYDEQMSTFNPQLQSHWRQQVMDYSAT